MCLLASSCTHEMLSTPPAATMSVSPATMRCGARGVARRGHRCGRLVDAVLRLRAHAPHDGLELGERQGLGFRVERRVVVERAELCRALEVRMAAKLLAQRAVEPAVVEEVVA